MTELTRENRLLTEEFLSQYEDFPKHMNALGRFVFYRTYSRFIPEKGRRESWKETVARATEYNVSLGVKHLEKIGYKVDFEKFRKEAEEFFHSMYNLRQFLSGRTLWIGGAEGGVADKYPLANFNCSYVSIKSWEDVGDLFYLLMVGTGVGFTSTKEMAAGLKPLRTDVEIVHEPFVQRFPIVKEAKTELFIIDNHKGKKAVLHIGDSKEGWVEAVRIFFRILSEDGYADISQLGIYYDYIRPKGTRLKTFGGTASGYEPLLEMFQGFERVIKNEIDPTLAPLEITEDGRVKLRPVHILDIGNLVGNNVVVGGVRRTAEIFLFDADDYESMFAKYGINGIWNVEQHKKVIDQLRKVGLTDVANQLEAIPTMDANARPLHHRRMSNNSIAFHQTPTKEFLDLVFEVMKAEGEPGFVNMAEANRRRPNAEGLNPCVEIILDSYGVCNLTTINMVQFVVEDEHGNKRLDLESLLDAQKRSARAGLRMTLVTLELPHWDAVQQRDRLLGTSLTGVQDAFDLIDAPEHYRAAVLFELGRVSRNEADRYAKEMRVSAPLLVTTVKPEGTISQVAGGVSSGLHYSHAPYYIRRIRINAADPLAKAVMDIGWTVHPEVGTPGDTKEIQLANARTLVIDFPIKSGASRTKDDVGAQEQLKTYFEFQSRYTEHNSSNTIHVRPDEWDGVSDTIHGNWDNFVGVSFLAHDGGSYQLAPYEAITEEQYEEMTKSFAEFDPSILEMYETGVDSDLDGMDGCEGGICPVR